jgi:hypothetical protein
MIATKRIDMVTDDPKYKIDEDRRVYVYKNLHRDCYSVRQDGLVKMHTNGICLYDAQFRVGKKGRERVLEEKRKNVHAGVSGYIDRDWDKQRFPPTNFLGVIYNPYSYETFVYADIHDRSKWTPIFWSHSARLSHVEGKARIDAVPCIEGANRY